MRSPDAGVSKPARAAFDSFVTLAFAAGLLTGGVALAPDPGHAQTVTFRHPLDDKPLDVTPRPNEQLTDAVKQFHLTGRNPYADDGNVLAEGQRLYRTWCQICHLPDGSGRMGPSLVDDVFGYERASTDIGMFEIIFGGAAGAMRRFNDRLSQDQILKLMAYLQSLKK
ncbi:MAG: c-type cytochrome [Pseudomonadota bacterium]